MKYDISQLNYKIDGHQILLLAFHPPVISLSNGVCHPKAGDELILPFLSSMRLYFIIMYLYS